MIAAHMSEADFEQLYRRERDPWGYESSPYERRKYAATLSACGQGPFAHALELGAAIGVLTAQLAPRCERLTTIDFAPSAVAIARERLAGFPHVAVLLGRIPQAIPDHGFDLVVASEILYYLQPDELERTLIKIERLLTPGGRLVAVHWRQPGPERPTSAAEVHAVLRARPGLAQVGRADDPEYQLDVLESRP